MKLTIDLSAAQAERLRDEAERLGLTPEDLARATVPPPRLTHVALLRRQSNLMSKQSKRSERPWAPLSDKRRSAKLKTIVAKALAKYGGVFRRLAK